MVKVGDKVRVTTDYWQPGCAKGSVASVVRPSGKHGIQVVLDGDDFVWFLFHHQYELIRADKPDPRDDPSNPDKLPLREMSDRVIAMIVRAGVSGREYCGVLGKWSGDDDEGLCLDEIYRIRPRTVRIEYDCDENGKPIMETGREVG